MAQEELPGVPAVLGITIDDKSTRDIDDALYIERLEDGWQLSISIADVGRVVQLGSDFDTKAKERVATRYYGSGNSPMLPRFLAENKLSLWPRRLRNVLVVRIRLGLDFETKAVEIEEVVLKSRAKLTYDEVPGILADKEHPGHELLTQAKTIAMGLLTKRRQKGAMVLYDLNNGWVTSEEGFIKKLENKDAVIGYIIIQEMMILANAEVAKLGAARGLPLLYRSHNARDAGPELEALVKVIQEGLDHPIAGLDELRKNTHKLLEKATYGSKNTGHFGLGLQAYLHFTSPIRRYADLVNHRQVKAMIHGEAPPYTVEQIEEVAQHINAQVLQEQRDTAEYMKAKAESRAVRALDARRLDGLSAKEFERVVKVETRGGADASEAFIHGYEQRLKERAVPLVCMTVLFGEAPEGPGWSRLKAATVQWLEKRPEDAMSILTQGAQVVGWPPVQFDTESIGPDHQKVFRAIAELGDQTVPKEHQSWASGRTLKEAKQRSCVRLLALLAGVTPPPFDNPEVYPPEQPAPEPPPPVDVKNAVGVLQEMCQKRGVSGPVYTFQQTGPNHVPVITCTCTFSGIERTAVDSSKKDAKQRAAKAVLEAIK